MPCICVQGMLGIGAALLGSTYCLALDIDAEALDAAQANVSAFEDLPVSLACWQCLTDSVSDNLQRIFCPEELVSWT